MTVRVTPLFAAAVLLAPGAGFAQSAPDRDRITALAKSFLRDSAELPMDVAVTTVVKDATGKQKRNAHSKTRFVFYGYNSQTGRGSFRSTAGLMSYRILWDSVGGNFAFLDALVSLAPRPEGLAHIAIEGGQSGEPFLLKSSSPPNCPAFALHDKYFYPDRKCFTTEFRVRQDGSGALTVERFAVDITGLPASGDVRYLGTAQVRRIHAEGEVQEARLPDDARPFLIPKRVTTTIESDKGTVEVTNTYSLSPAPQKK